MDFSFGVPSADDYVSLRLRSGMGDKDLNRSKVALANSLFTFSIYNKKELIGFGRVVGDGAITYVVSDVMVDSRYQGRGYGKKIMGAIDVYLRENTSEDSFVCLLANCPFDKLYSKFGFEYLNDRVGMLRNQRK